MSDPFCNTVELLAGVDEVGRGPLAGPVIAAAVVLDNTKPIVGLADSKKLTHQRRVYLTEQIKMKAKDWSLGRAEVCEIDTLNILNASLLAMKRAVEGLKVKLELVLVDGPYTPDLAYNSRAIIKGDSRVQAISAASIIAKVARDQEMEYFSKMYPGYGFDSHKGYPTKQHLAALQRLGITEIHRIHFAPVMKLIRSHSSRIRLKASR